MYICVYIYTYIYIYTSLSIHIYIYIYIGASRDLTRRVASLRFQPAFSYCKSIWHPSTQRPVASYNIITGSPPKGRVPSETLTCHLTFPAE